jgi:hypothetical protein
MPPTQVRTRLFNADVDVTDAFKDWTPLASVAENAIVDVYATDRACWRSLWWPTGVTRAGWKTST